MPTGVRLFNNQTPRGPTTPPIAPTGGAGLDRTNIDILLRGDFDPYEINTQSAENAIGSGTGGSGFAMAGRYKLLDSEKLSRQAMGHQFLQPYLQREHESTLQDDSQRARMEEIAKQGELAMEQLQASLSGQMAQLTERERAELERQILSGRQALEQIRANQAGQQELQRGQIGGNILTSLLSQYGRPSSNGGGSANYNQARYGGRSFRYQTDNNGTVTGGTPPPADYWTPSGGGSSINGNVVQSILSRYGIRL